MAKAYHPKGWSLSTHTPKKDTPQLTRGVKTGDTREKNENKSSSRPARPSILQRITSMRSIRPGDQREEGSRVCGMVTKFQLNTNPHDGVADYVATCEEKNEEGDTTPFKRTQNETTPHNDNNNNNNSNNNNNQPELNSVVTVFHHKASSCYEVSTYDINTKTELNRLYVPAEEVADLTETKKRRMSFLGGGGGMEKSLSAKFGDLMAFTHDENQQPCVDILRPDPDNPRRKSSIAFPKPDSITPVTVPEPNFNKDGSLGPQGKRISLLHKIGRRLSIFGGKKSTPIVPTQSSQSPSFGHSPIAENTAVKYQDGPKQKPQKLSDIPLQKSSTNLTNNMKYEKSVDTMLSEASQMRADLAAKRAAKANGDDSDSKRFGKKRQIKY